MKKYASLLSGLTLVALVSACSPAPEQAATTATTAAATTAASPASSPATDATPSPDASKSDAKPDATASNGTWQDYKSSTGKFSIKVPSKPQEQSQEQHYQEWLKKEPSEVIARLRANREQTKKKLLLIS